ncbi:MAG: T9SS type A sorting domain-containing protein, partial [Ekhidna sp.]|nr:T9SS type A sorting domain-containing protein [Ekhidna sp.]
CPVAAIADLTAPTATDNCDDGTITATTNASFPITSTTTITWTYTDDAGNAATQTQAVICPLGTEDEEAAVIFPNPSGRYLEVRSPVEGTFKILSLSGKSLLKGTTNTKVDITSLQSGLYLVQLPDGRLLKFVRE